MEEAAQYTKASVLRDPRVPETFHVGKHPPGFAAYWAYMCTHDIRIGIQLQVIPFKAYHLPELNKPQELWEYNLELLRQEETNRGVVERVYSITHRASGKSRLFHHFQLEWRDMGLPDEDALSSVMSSYASLIREDEACRNVHVHCWGGFGRSGTFVLARVLSFYPGISQPDAMQILAGLRRTRSIVETAEQEDFAFVFSSRLATEAEAGQSTSTGEEKASECNF